MCFGVWVGPCDAQKSKAVPFLAVRGTEAGMGSRGDLGAGSGLSAAAVSR